MAEGHKTMHTETLKHNTTDNMFGSASSVSSGVSAPSNDGAIGRVRIPGSTNGSSVDCFRYFKLFMYLNDDMKLNILSYVADAPFEKLPECYPISGLTHYLPRVNKKFREIANSDQCWKPAIERLIRKEPRMWRDALNHMCPSPEIVAPMGQESTAVVILDNESDGRTATRLTHRKETIMQLIERTHHALGQPSYKFIYMQVVNKYLRAKAPVYVNEGHVTLGEPYTISLNEPKYRLMINEVMKDHSIDERRNAALVRQDAIFIHANRLPLESTQTAVLVQIVTCTMHANGIVDVHVTPVAHVWLEKFTVRPNTFGLIEAQCLKMGQRHTNEMNHLTRQEAMAQVMDNMTREFETAMNTATSSSHHAALVNDPDGDSYLSNQYEVTGVEDNNTVSDNDSMSSSDDDDDDVETNDSSIMESDAEFDSDYDDDDDDIHDNDRNGDSSAV